MRAIYLVILTLFYSTMPAFSAEENLQLLIKDSHSVLMTPYAVALGNLTDDQNLDAVIVGKLGTIATFRCFPGEGDGAFDDFVYEGNLYLDPVDVLTGDFNGDGITDIVALNSACT